MNKNLGWLMAASAAASVSLGSAAKAQEITFPEWLDGFRSEAAAAGIRREVIVMAFEGVVANDRVAVQNDSQPEFNRAIWDYIEGVVSQKRIEGGAMKRAMYGPLLADIEAQYGVDAAIVLAIWGIESSYGEIMGEQDAIEALATLAWRGRRTAYGREQLIGALRILDSGYAARGDLKGSWAGAMGHTQFIPTTYLAYAVDHDSDGRRDIWTNLGDVFASTANYLKRSGFQAGVPWGVEVILPEGFDYSLATPENRRAVTEWSAVGVKGPAKDLAGAFDPNLRGRILLPAGAKGPAFMVFENFEAILKYNRSTAYALSVGNLANRLAGDDAPLSVDWPREDRPLALAERKVLQQALKDKGFDPGPVDGVIGSGTMRALRTWQRSIGLPADGYASADVLLRLTSS